MQRRYKAAVAKTERILDSTTEIQSYAPEDLFRLLILEASAINKLLTRNLLKKYKYDVKVVDDLIRMLVRNLSEVHDLLS